MAPVVAGPVQLDAVASRVVQHGLAPQVAHVHRRDAWQQLTLEVVRALYWFHPLAWHALRKLRLERELACDDCVLMSGERPTEYAQQLLDIALAFRLPKSILLWLFELLIGVFQFFDK